VTTDNPLLELSRIAYQLPTAVLEDVNKRIGDWLATGGKQNDQYIWQQLKFAQNFLPQKE
jgi:hypothetical protein